MGVVVVVEGANIVKLKRWRIRSHEARKRHENMVYLNLLLWGSLVFEKLIAVEGRDDREWSGGVGDGFRKNIWRKRRNERKKERKKLLLVF